MKVKADEDSDSSDSGTWSHILNEEIWNMTRLACTLSFKRAKVYPHSASKCIDITGHCTECNAKLCISSESLPEVNTPAVLKCRIDYIDDSLHTGKAKHMLSGEKRLPVSEKLWQGKKLWQATEAYKIMPLGNPDPTHLPSLSTLRKAKQERGDREEFVTVWVRDPRLHKEDFWHTHTDYEICLHTNSMCFRKKTSCVRRRYSEFVWLRQRLQDNALLIHVPKLPPANPFFSLNNTLQVTQRMEGLQKFLEEVLHMPLLLSDSHLHLFLQSQLSITKMEACVQGQTRYTVAEAIQRSVCDTRFPLEDESKSFSDSDSESSSSVLAFRVDPATPIEMSSQDGRLAHHVLAMESQPELFKCLSTASNSQQDLQL
ncbi:sorting nexin-10A [Trichomycterus rosablanca]|uniref:sorting nexin-10A n=1 Tax=Trichomycterus rosablanca TaxID=2290929 RepID=UPI002F35591E